MIISSISALLIWRYFELNSIIYEVMPGILFGLFVFGIAKIITHLFSPNTQKMIYRHPCFNDGLTIYNLIKSCPPLDINSIYYYYVLCRDFSETCVVAEWNKKIVGFISAYRKPQEMDCLFVWQVAVAEQARGKKLAANLLDWLINQSSCVRVKNLETTISSSNQPSQMLFKRFAERHQAVYHTSNFLETSRFGHQKHEEEILFRIESIHHHGETLICVS